MTVYDSNLKRKGSFSMMPPPNRAALAGAEGSGFSIKSPTNGSDIPLHVIEIPSEEVWDKLYKSIYNTRSRELMTPATVLDILPDIRSVSHNITPVIAVKGADGRFEVLSGMKRSFAVSISPGTKLIVHYAEKMIESDKQIIARTSDKHEKPSFLDAALTLKTYEEEVGDQFTTRKAADIFGLSKSAVADMMTFSKLPNELFTLFPGAKYVTWRFLKSVVASKQTNNKIIAAIKDIKPIQVDVEKVLLEGAEDALKAECKQLESVVLEALKGRKNRAVKSFAPSSPLHASKLISGIEAKPGYKNSVTLKIDSVFMESEAGRALLRLISNEV